MNSALEKELLGFSPDVYSRIAVTRGGCTAAVRPVSLTSKGLQLAEKTAAILTGERKHFAPPGSNKASGDCGRALGDSYAHWNRQMLFKRSLRRTSTQRSASLIFGIRSSAQWRVRPPLSEATSNSSRSTRSCIIATPNPRRHDPEGALATATVFRTRQVRCGARIVR